MTSKSRHVALMAEGMIRVEMIDGTVCTGRDAHEVVERMRETSWGAEESDGVQGYMKQVAKRVYDWSGSLVRFDNAEIFLADCTTAGIIKYKPKMEDK